MRKVKVNNEINDIAYMQVKDLSKPEMRKFLYSMDGLFLQTQI